MLTEEPPVRSVSSKDKRFLNLFPGALWEGGKVGRWEAAASFRDWGGIRGAGLEMKPEVPQDPASERTERKKKSRLN